MSEYKTATDLCGVISELCDELRASPVFDDKLEFVSAAPGDCIVRSDVAASVVRVVREAVSNAIRYAHPSGVAGRIAVTCQRETSGAIAVSVVDDGVGLPENFDPVSGGGEGLAAMRSLSDRVGGTLSFKSSSLGLRVRLRLPEATAPSFAGRKTRINGSDGRLGEYAVLLASLPAAVYMTDREGRITFYNEAAVALWGGRPELGKSEFCGSWKLYHADGRPMRHDECPMAVALREQCVVRNAEAIAERPDGTRVPFIPYPTPLFDNSGALVGAINMLVDISDRKRIENELARRSEEQAALYELTDALLRARCLSEVCDAGLAAIGRALSCRRASIMLVDRQGVMRFVGWRGLSDAYRAAVEGHSPWTLETVDPQPICVTDVDAADLSPDLKEAIKAEGIAAFAFIPLVADGRLVGNLMTYYERAHAFSDAEIDFAVVVARQLGFSVAHLQAEESRGLLAAIIETSDDAIVSKDLNGIVTSWNHGAVRVFGYTAEEMIGRSIATLVPDNLPDEEPSILERIRRGERVDHYETVRMRKDGSVVDISLTVSPLKDASGRIVGASKIARDITERKRAQARQELLTREIQHRTKNLFAVVMAVVARSFAGRRTAKEAETAVMDRLHSLAQTHAMLVDRQWMGADLDEVVRTEMKPYVDRVRIEGESLVLNAKAAQNFALALHELATNAVKYGALSNATGQVHIRWTMPEPGSSDPFCFAWQEHGGPPVSLPTHRGFGSVVLEKVMAEYFNAPPRVDFAPAGVRYEISCSLGAVVRREQDAA